MESDYGKIITTVTTNEQNGTKIVQHTCTICGESKPTKYKIKPHISSHNQLQKHTDIYFPYCPELFKDLQTLNRHLHINNICTTIKGKLLDNAINWKQVWKDICERNKFAT